MSMKASINVLSQANGRKVAILGDMFEIRTKTQKNYIKKLDRLLLEK